MGSGHRFSFLMQHCNNHKSAHQLTFYCPDWTVDFDLNSVSECACVYAYVCARICMCFRGSVINTSLRAKVSKALYHKLILLSAKSLNRHTKPKCPSHFPSSSSQTHTNTNSPPPTNSSTPHSFSCSHHCRINTAENDLDLKSSNCPCSLALKSQTSKKNILETRTTVTELLQYMFYCELRRLQAWPKFSILAWRTTIAIITNAPIFHIVALVIAVMAAFTDL